MQRFSIIGTAHIADPRLLDALEAALDEARPDQLILEMPDEVAARGDIEGQKPEMVRAWRWAQAHGVPVRGHDPPGPPILRDGLSPERIAALVGEMDLLIQDLAPRRIIEMFCGRGFAETPGEARLAAIVQALVDPDKAALRTEAILDAIRERSAREGSIVIVCGGAHAQRLMAALPNCRVLSGEHLF